MEYIKQLFNNAFDNSGMLVYGVTFIVAILIVALVLWIFIKRRNLVNQNLDVSQISSGNLLNNMNMDNTQSIQSPALNKDNILMNPQDILNNSFVNSAEENAAKRAAESVNNNKNNATNA